MPRALTSTTSVTPGTRSRMILSMPALRVWVEAGQVTQAPKSSTGDERRGVLIDLDQLDVALVGNDGRPDDLDDPLHFGPHPASLAAPGPNSDPLSSGYRRLLGERGVVWPGPLTWPRWWLGHRRLLGERGTRRHAMRWSAADVGGGDTPPGGVS